MAPTNTARKTYANRSLLNNCTQSKRVLNDLFAKNIKKRLSKKIKDLPARTETALQNDSLNITTNDTFDKLKFGELLNPVKIVNSYRKYDSSESDMSKSAFIKSISLTVPTTGITSRSRRKYINKNQKNESVSYIRPRLEETTREEERIDVSLEIENMETSMQLMHSYKTDSSLSKIFTNNYMEKQTLFSSTPVCNRTMRRSHNYAPFPNKNTILEKSYEEIEQWENKKPDVSSFTVPSRQTNILPLKPSKLETEDFDHAIKDYLNTQTPNKFLKINAPTKKAKRNVINNNKKDKISISESSKIHKTYKNKEKLKPVTVNLERLILSSKDSFNKLSVSLDLWNKFEKHSKSYLTDQSSIIIFENQSKSRYPLRNNTNKEKRSLFIVQNKSESRCSPRNVINKKETKQIYLNKNKRGRPRKSINNSNEKVIPKNMVVNLEQLPLSNRKLIDHLKKDIKQPIVNLTLNDFNEIICDKKNTLKCKQPIINLTLNNFDHLFANNDKCIPIYDLTNSSDSQDSIHELNGKNGNQSLLIQNEFIYFNQSSSSLSSDTNCQSLKCIYSKSISLKEGNDFPLGKTRARRNRKYNDSLNESISNRTRSRTKNSQLSLDYSYKNKKLPKSQNSASLNSPNEESNIEYVSRRTRGQIQNSTSQSSLDKSTKKTDNIGEKLNRNQNSTSLTEDNDESNISFESIFEIIGIDASQRSFYFRSQSSNADNTKETKSAENNSQNKEKTPRKTRNQLSISLASETNNADFSPNERSNVLFESLISSRKNSRQSIDENQRKAIFDIIGCDMSQTSVINISTGSLTDSQRNQNNSSDLNTFFDNVVDSSSDSPVTTRNQDKFKDLNISRTKNIFNTKKNISFESPIKSGKTAFDQSNTDERDSVTKRRQNKSKDLHFSNGNNILNRKKNTSPKSLNNSPLNLKNKKKEIFLTENKKDTSKDWKPINCDTISDISNNCDIISDSEPILSILDKNKSNKTKNLRKKKKAKSKNSDEAILKSIPVSKVNQMQNKRNLKESRAKPSTKQSMGDIENVSPKRPSRLSKISKNSENSEKRVTMFESHSKENESSDSESFVIPLSTLIQRKDQTKIFTLNKSNDSKSNSFLTPLPTTMHRKTLRPGKEWRRSLAILKRSSMIIPENAEIITTESTLINDKDHISKLSQASPNRRSSIRVVAVSTNVSGRNSILEKYAHASYVSVQDFVDSHLENSVRKLSINQQQQRKPLLTKSIAAVVTAKEVVLRRCGQTEPLPFEKCYPESLLKNCQKIGEGVYGEVFLFKNPNGGTSVMKVIPIEGDQIINGERQKKFEEIISEIIIAMELSNLRNNKKNSTSGFSEVQKIRCVQGRYPEKLLDLWDLYEETRGSENDSPIIFNKDQLYIVLELANGGKDLEAYVFNNALQAFSMFKQVAISLAIAESELNFEHRDLHWGNVLLTTVDKRQKQNFCLDGKVLEVETHGVEVAIIDFTLSRIEFDGVVIFNDLSQDPDLFTATGDYQFEIYRQMQKKNGDNWYHFEPFTNLLWLHYTLDKSITALRYKSKQTKVHNEYIKKMCLLKDEILNYHSVKDFVLDNF
ncbi:unnamed protein product [Brassicogethes aeneus]|uniref:non-specific serine/threonine protein kinase n=1 Tax=Brassicogethes aeneus TaxID=1431903 RepID=A0A9P0B1R7_BRAAE|nr:unnamed protein product [Brassicogethes aeneus]